MERPKEPLPIRRKEMSVKDLREQFQPLLPAEVGDRRYHVFVSYRHGRDSEYTAHFVNALSKLPVGAAGEHMLVFYDCYSLEDGQQFDDSFMRGLANAHVVTPFVSTDALSRMCSEANLTHIDHVLLEWWLTITLFKDKDSPLKAVLPVFRGNIGVERDGRPFVGNLFASFKKTKLPDKVNEPTFARLNKFLQEHVPNVSAKRMTVRAVYEELCTFNASKTCCWELFAQMAHGCSWSDLQAKKTTGTASVEEAARLENVLQRLFAKCAEPVKKEVEKAVTASDA